MNQSVHRRTEKGGNLTSIAKVFFMTIHNSHNSKIETQAKTIEVIYTVGHDKLGNKIDIVVPEPAELGLGRLALLVEKLKELLQRADGSTLATVVVIAVHVQDLLAVDREQAGDDALLQGGRITD